MTEDDVRDLLRELGDEPVPADSLLRVRLGVVERTQRRRWFAWWPLAAAVAACLVLFAVLRPKQVALPQPVPAAVARVPERPLPSPELPQEPKLSRARVIKRQRLAVRAKSVTTPAADTIRIETPDPDVVILLTGE